jgi:hypothetical protein
MLASTREKRPRKTPIEEKVFNRSKWVRICYSQFSQGSVEEFALFSAGNVPWQPCKIFSDGEIRFSLCGEIVRLSYIRGRTESRGS